MPSHQLQLNLNKPFLKQSLRDSKKMFKNEYSLVWLCSETAIFADTIEQASHQDKLFDITAQFLQELAGRAAERGCCRSCRILDGFSQR